MTSVMPKKIKNTDSKVPVPHFIAWVMFNQGEAQPTIAEYFKVDVRTIRRWVRNVEQAMASTPEWTKAVMVAKGFLSKSINIITKYLDGKGERVGGDLEAAFKIMRIFKVLEPASLRGAGPVNIGKQIVTAINADIVVNPQEDEEFADAVPEQLIRIVGALERLSPNKMVEEPTESEDTDN